MLSDPYLIQDPLANEEAIMELWQSSRLSITTEYETQPEVLKIGDAVIGTLGNFSASIGKAKSKKTFNCSAIVASALINDCVLNYISDFPEEKRKVLYIDTEQGVSHCQKVLQRIYKLTGLSTDQDCELLEFLALRKFSPEVRIAIIKQAIIHTDRLGLVIIDGIRDLVYDINNPTEATNIISMLMQLTDEYQIHIHVILHQNKGDDNARGHLGTELINKAETVIQVEKDKNDHDISKVEAVHIRTKEFEPFAFRINDGGLPEVVGNYVFEESSSGRPKKEPFDPNKVDKALHEVALLSMFPSSDVGYKYKELQTSLIPAYSKVGIKLNNNKAVTLITWLRNKRIVIQENAPGGKRNILNPERSY